MKGEKERKPKQETRGDAEESTETLRVPQRWAPRWRERVKPTRRRRGPGLRGERRAKVIDDEAELRAARRREVTRLCLFFIF